MPALERQTSLGSVALLASIEGEEKKVLAEMQALLKLDAPTENDSRNYRRLKKRHNELRVRRHAMKRAVRSGSFRVKEGGDGGGGGGRKSLLRRMSSKKLTSGGGGGGGKKHRPQPAAADGAPRGTPKSTPRSTPKSTPRADNGASPSKVRFAEPSGGASTPKGKPKLADVGKDDERVMSRKTMQAEEDFARLHPGMKGGAGKGFTAFIAANVEHEWEDHDDARRRKEEKRAQKKLDKGRKAAAAAAPEPQEMERDNSNLRRLEDEQQEMLAQHPVFTCMTRLYICAEEGILQCFHLLVDCPCLSKWEEAETRKWGRRSVIGNDPGRARRSLVRRGSARCISRRLSRRSMRARPRKPVAV